MQQYIKALHKKASPVRWQSVIALEHLGKPAVDYLVYALKDRANGSAMRLPMHWGTSVTSALWDPLIDLLTDKDQDVQFVAADALGRLGDPKAAGALYQTNVRDNNFVKIAAAEAMAKIAH